MNFGLFRGVGVIWLEPFDPGCGVDVITEIKPIKTFTTPSSAKRSFIAFLEFLSGSPFSVYHKYVALFCCLALFGPRSGQVVPQNGL